MTQKSLKGCFKAFHILDQAVVERRRQKGRPKLKWEDGVMGDARKWG
jgi:hypothetical protein